jgi:hypothetical protein
MMSKIFPYLGLAMGTVFIAAGIVLAIKPEWANLGPEFKGYTIWIAFVVILYGGFRLYRSYLLLKEKE